MDLQINKCCLQLKRNNICVGVMKEFSKKNLLQN